jgi:TolB-like protein
MKRLTLLLIALALSGLTATQLKADSLETVAKRLTKGVEKLKTKRIAVLSFPYHNGDVSSGSSIVAERLTTLMVQRGSEVVERALLDKAMGEIKLGMTGIMDPATTQKLGKVLGVNAIVTGTLIDLEENETEVNARLIETETGSILAADETEIKRTWEDLPQPPPRPVKAVADDESASGLHMSKLISNSSPRRHATPIYDGPMQPLEPASIPTAGPDVLTLTNDDLIPIRYNGQTEPAEVVDQMLSDHGPPREDEVHIARRIYHRNPDPRVRGRALLAMGHLLERSGRPRLAAQAYGQVLREFPDAPALQTEARQQLTQLSSPH